jgi:hypothetical protein
MNVLFVLWGTKYNRSHVENLYNQLKQYGRDDFKYYCFTDQQLDIVGITEIPIDPKLHLHGVWNKLYMFSRDFPVSGDIMYFDLDTIIQDNPFNVGINFDKLTVVDCHWKSPSIVRITNNDVLINSSVLAWNSNNPDIHHIWDHFQLSGYRDYFLRKYVGIDRYLVHEGYDVLFDKLPHDYILSYKHEDHSKGSPVVTFEEVDFGSVDFIPNTKAG